MTARLALALLFIVPAALAYPYETVTQRWILGVAVAVVIVLFAWWKGDFATTKLARRWSIWRGNHSGRRAADAGDTATVLLRIDEPAADDLPVTLIAGYTDRYGLRCDKVRITSRDLAGERQTWITLTLDAAENLRSLQARSPRIPLHDTAAVLGRRLADHLRENGWTVTVIDDADRAVPLSGEAKETWRAITDGAGFLTAYRIPATSLPEALAAVWAHPSEETWTAVEFGPGRWPRYARCAPPIGPPPPRRSPVWGRWAAGNAVCSTRWIRCRRGASVNISPPDPSWPRKSVGRRP